MRFAIAPISVSTIDDSTIDIICHLYRVHCITISRNASNLGMGNDQWDYFFRLCISSLLHETQHGPLKEREIDAFNVVSQYIARYPTNPRQQPWNKKGLKSAWTYFVHYSPNNAPWYLEMLRSVGQVLTKAILCRIYHYITISLLIPSNITMYFLFLHYLCFGHLGGITTRSRSILCNNWKDWFDKD